MTPDIRAAKIATRCSTRSRSSSLSLSATRLVLALAAVWVFCVFYVLASPVAAVADAQDPAGVAAPAAQPAGSGQTVWSGVYGVEQAKRGEKVATDTCSACHGPELEGGEVGPPLVGADFLATWNNLTVWDLFDRIHTTMPMDAPGSLTVPTYGDVLAYILSRNKFPSGAAELSTEMAALKQIKITTQP